MTWALGLLLALAPFAFGTVNRVSWSLIAVLVGLLLLVWCVQASRRGGPYVRLSGWLWVAGALYGGALCWALVQASGWFPELHHPIWADAEAALGRDLPGAISIDPHGTLTALLPYLLYACVFWLALHLARSERATRSLLLIVAVAIAVHALYGLVMKLSGAELVLWMEKNAYRGSVTGAFINRNSFATYLGLGLLLFSMLLLQQLDQRGWAHLGWRELGLRLIQFLSGRGGRLILAWAVVLSALILTHSRAGLAVAMVGLVALILALGGSGRVAWRYVLAAVVPIALLFTIFMAVSGKGTLLRLDAEVWEADVRGQIYALTIQGISEHPWTGSGLGTFEDALTLRQDESLFTYVMRAHSGYLESALDLGLPAAGMIWASLLLLTLVCLFSLRRRVGQANYAALGVAASLLVGLHALVDFSLQIPAVTVTYAAILGLAVGRCTVGERIERR